MVCVKHIDKSLSEQHGTAVINLAGLTNALKVVGKKKEEVKVVTVGAGAAGIAIVKMLLTYAEHPAVQAMCTSMYDMIFFEESSQEIYRQFDELRQERTTIFVSHRLSSATVASKIIVLEHGRLVLEKLKSKGYKTVQYS